MAKITARNVKLFGGGRNLSGRANSSTLSLTAESSDVSAYGTDTRERLHDGLLDYELSVAGWMDVSACQVDELFSDLLGASARWGYYPGGATACLAGKEMNAVCGDYSSEGAVEGAAAFSATLSGSSALFDVTSLASSTVQVVGSSNLGSVDFAAACSHTIWSFFRVETIAGSTPEIAACIQESTDDSSFTTLNVFTAASTANQVFAASAASSARYRRARVSLAASPNGVVSPCATFQISSGSAK